MEIRLAQSIPQEYQWMHFPVLLLELECEMRDRFRLPAFAGSMFRGALGWALREVCSDEVYRYLFETSSGRPGEADAARPFLLVPPLEMRQLEPGARFRVELRLFGEACDYVSQFFRAFERAGAKGLGKAGARFHLVKVLLREGERSWVIQESGLAAHQIYEPLPSALGSFARLAETDERQKICFHFHTPTRLVHRGERVMEPTLTIIAKTLWRRLESLLAVHGGAQALVLNPGDLEWAKEAVGDYELRWVDWERRSNRQGKKHIMGGVVGRAHFQGSIPSAWFQLLKLGEITHIGKATTFGMGGYRLSTPP